MCPPHLQTVAVLLWEVQTIDFSTIFNSDFS